MSFQKYSIDPGKKVKIFELDPGETSEWDKNKEEGLKKLAEYQAELGKYQERLYASHKEKILVLFQAMDTGGKDGVIRDVFKEVNPLGLRVASFKVPTPIELDHDFLWRVHAQVPGKGELVVFNRSHYEQVLVVRVHNLEPEERWRKHYQQINEFEKMLVDEGTTILKFYLHIDADEQRVRLQERIDTPEKNWKFNPGDLKERTFWTDYMRAFEEMLERTSTDWAPWYVIPANRNWYRNLAVSAIICDRLKELKLAFPAPVEDIKSYRDKII